MYIARISIPRTKQFRVVTVDDTFVFDELSGGGNLLSEQKLFLRVPMDVWWIWSCASSTVLYKGNFKCVRTNQASD